MTSLHGHRPTRAEIDLGALERNFLALRAHLGAIVKILAVVKADAYGHGAVPVSQRLEAVGVDAFGVAMAEEGIALREAGLRSHILVFGGHFPGQEALVIQHNLTPVVYSLDALRALDAAASRMGRPVPYHLKLDTGMGRLGLHPNDAVRFLVEARKLKSVQLTGVMTHLSSAEENDQSFTDLQAERFRRAFSQIEAAGIAVPLRHAANSAAALFRPDIRFDMVRAGLILYGIASSPKGTGIAAAPVMSFKTCISFLKRVPSGTPISYGRSFVATSESLIATLPVGYADGLQRRLSNKGHSIVRGRLAPIAGNVTMDSTLIDVTNVPGVAVGDEVVLVGRQGEQRIGAEEVAQAIGTIPYEVTCAISKRVPRVYL